MEYMDSIQKENTIIGDNYRDYMNYNACTKAGIYFN